MEKIQITLLALLALLALNCSSSLEVELTSVPDCEHEISIVPNLEQSDGYYRLYVERSNLQTIHGISLYTDFIKSTRIEWTANSTWILQHYGDDCEVPIINSVSYTSIDDGTAQTMFAPVVELVGDTVLVTATACSVSDSVYIILE